MREGGLVEKPSKARDIVVHQRAVDDQIDVRFRAVGAGGARAEEIGALDPVRMPF